MISSLLRLAPDLSPLRDCPPYRRLFFASCLSAIGSQITLFAITLQVYERTGSSFAVGAIGLFTGVPAIAIALWGGTIADTIDRKRLVFFGMMLQTFLSLGMCALASLHAEGPIAVYALYALYVLVGAQYLIGAFNVPAMSAIVPRLVAKEQLTAVAVLKMASMHGSLVLGPLIAGVLAARISYTMLFLVDACTFAVALWAVAMLPSIPPAPAAKQALGWAGVLDGWAFICTSRAVAIGLLVDLALALLGNSSALLPALNSQVFGGNKETLGLLMAATPLGGVFAMAVSGVLKRAANLQAVLISCAVAWAICLLCLALSSWLALSLAMLALMGMFDSVAVVIRSTIVQLHTPDRLRGRISSVEYIVGNAAAQLGNVRAGLLGTILSVPTALALTSATTLLAVLFAPAIAMTLRKQALRNA